MSERLAQFTPEMAIEYILETTFDADASDIYFVSTSEGVEVSYRRLGIVKKFALLEASQGQRSIAQVCVLTDLKRADRQHPQEGRWNYTMRNEDKINLRVSIIPTVHGDSLSLRLVDRSKALRPLNTLGFVGNQHSKLISLLSRPSGLILFSGPMASGKTSTVYSCLDHLNDGTKTIHTLESPVELLIDGLRQTSYSDNSTVTKVELLKGILKQGPDVVMVTDLKDPQFAELIIETANSGRLVLAITNAPLATSAITQLYASGISPYFLSTCLLGVVSQRLMRTLNPENRIKMDLSMAPKTFEEVQSYLKPGEGEHIYAAGLGGSIDDAYGGVTEVFEILTISDTLRRMISKESPTREIIKSAKDEGMLDFRRSAMLKVAKGYTSFDEMQRIVPLDVNLGDED